MISVTQLFAKGAKDGAPGGIRLSSARTLSNLRRPAIDEQFDSGDEAGIIRSQKKCRLGNFLWLADPAHRDQRHELILDLLRNSDKHAVSMVPGLMTFTRIFRAFRSTVHVRAKERTAALLAL